MSGFNRFLLVLAALLSAFVAGPATAQDAPDIAGTWSGVIAVPTGDLTLVLYVKRGADGALGATIENFEQNPGNPTEITEISASGGTLAFKVAPIGGIRPTGPSLPLSKIRDVISAGASASTDPTSGGATRSSPRPSG